jgi:hypothetical protein
MVKFNKPVLIVTVVTWTVQMFVLCGHTFVTQSRPRTPYIRFSYWISVASAGQTATDYVGSILWGGSWINFKIPINDNLSLTWLSTVFFFVSWVMWITDLSIIAVKSVLI